MRIRTLTCMSLALVLSAAASAETVRMRPALARETMHYGAFASLDEQGRASIEFAGGDGRLRIERRDGRLYVDANRDGVIDEADGEGVASGGNVGVRFEIGGAWIRYPLTLTLFQNRYVRVSGRMTLEGEWNGRRIRLYDTNVNGRFDERERDGISVGDEFHSHGAPPLGSVIQIGDRLHGIEVLAGGMEIALSELDVPHATVRLTQQKDASVTMRLVNAQGHVLELSGEAESPAIPGEYWIRRNTYFSAGSRGGLFRNLVSSPEHLHGWWRENEAPAVVLDEGENVLSPGPPFDLHFDAVVWGDPLGFYNISKVWISGRMGERYSATSGVRISICRGAETLESAKMEFG